MKKINLILVILPLSVIALLTALCFIKADSHNHTKEFIDKHNYPYTGIYGQDSAVLTESDALALVSSNKYIGEYAENLTLKIGADQKVVLSGTLKNTEKLFQMVKELAPLKLLAGNLEGENVSVSFTLSEGNENTVDVNIAQITIGQSKLEAALADAILGDKANILFKGTAYNSVQFRDGAVTFKNGLPLYLKQLH